MRPKPLVLVILDGWGVAAASSDNAVRQAATPHFDGFISEYPAMTLVASGEALGLPRGQAGSSEVSHLTMGAGFALYQALPRITKAIEDETFFQNTALLKAIAHTRRHKSRLHLIGLVSSGGIHSHIDHLFALLELARRENVEEVYVHAILDGRDTAYNSGADFVARLEKKMQELGLGRMASVAGRAYAMDRDNHWDRIQRVYEAMVHGRSNSVASSVREAVERSYAEGVYDEEFVPTVIKSGSALADIIKKNDSVIFFNFRPDRGRELTAALTQPSFTAFDRGSLPERICFVTMTTYEKSLPVLVAYPRQVADRPVAKIVSEAGLRQLHIAETEKYAHVTYFFNGGTEEPFVGEDNVLIPSPSVVSYAEVPNMSASAIVERMVREILNESYDVIVANFANADMVGHTGNLQATIASVAAVDRCLGDIADAVLAKNGLLIVTADHGNAEALVHTHTGDINKSHTTNPVPLLIIANQLRGKTAGLPDVVGSDLSLQSPAGTLADVAPTMLKILELPIPIVMTGRSLL